MKFYILLLLLLPVAMPICSVGDSYTCNPNLNMCKKQTTQGTGSYELNPCSDPNKYYCPSTSGDQICKERKDKLPGIKCTQDIECLNGICTNGKCYGIPLGSASSDWKKCDVGLTSIGNTCVNQKKIGEQCTDDTHCTNDAVCVNQICVQKWSIPNGQELGEYQCNSLDFKNFACSSGSCYILRVDSKDIGYCSPTKISKEEYDQCLDSNRQTTCATTYSDGKIPTDARSVEYGDCMDTHGLTSVCFCEAQPGDNYYRDKIVKEKLILGVDNLVCKVAFDPECWYQNQWDIETKAIYKDWLKLDTLVREGDTVFDWDKNKCIPQVFYPWFSLWQDVDVQLECSNYKCSDQLAPHVCIQYEKQVDTFNLRPCSDDMRTYCNKDLTLDSIECQEVTAVIKKYPGQTCSDNNQCLSGTCSSSKKCVGSVLDCKINSDCEVGYYCDGAKCKNQKTANEQCTSDYDCWNNLICFNQRCTKKFQIQTESTLEYDQVCPSSKIWEACESFTCEETGKNKGKCISPYLSVDQPPMKCDQDSTVCQGYQQGNERKKIKGTCNCGINQNGDGYCSQFTGDWGFSLYKAIWQELEELNNDQWFCHTELRQSVDCWKQNWPNNDYLIARVEQLQIYKNIQSSYAQTVDTDDCVDQIYNLAEAQFYNDFNLLECKVWDCADQNHTLEKNHCIQYWSEEKSFYVNPCNESSENSYCQPVINVDDESMCQKTKEKFKQIPLYPGDVCDYDYECYTKICSKGKCSGIGSGKECKGDDDFSCNVGYACILEQDKYKCLKQKQVGQECKNDYQCINKAVCRNNLCYEAYSQKVGSTFTGTCDDSRINTVCESSQCEPDAKDPTKFKCIEAYKSRSLLPVSCQIEQIDCAASINVDIYTSCSCSLSPHSIAFCNLHPGDEPYVQQIVSWRNISDYDQDKCHTKSRFNMWCWENALQEEQFYQGLNYTSQKYYAQNYPQLIQSPECVQKIYHKQYWESLNYIPDEDEDHAFLLLFSTLVFILF